MYHKLIGSILFSGLSHYSPPQLSGHVTYSPPPPSTLCKRKRSLGGMGVRKVSPPNPLNVGGGAISNWGSYFCELGGGGELQRSLTANSNVVQTAK